VLAGEDVLRGLSIPMCFHRMQVEYELREKLVLIRQNALVADGDDKVLLDLLVRSLPSVVTLFRHALICFGEKPPDENREAVKKLAERIGFDAATITVALDLREKRADRRQVKVQEIFAAYLVTMEKVANRVDEILDQDAPAR
jgi:hypothetical protein